MVRRKFGKTGLETSLLGFGGYHLLEIPFTDANLLLNTYLDAGGNYIETAAMYGDGESELKIGKAVGKRRDEFILTTKVFDRSKQGFLDSLDRSLGFLHTDHVDLVLMHAVGSMSELETILGDGGALEGFEIARKAGKANFVGISMHGQPDVLISALGKHPFDAVMTTINYYDHFNFPAIENTLVPLAREKECAIILMKPVADGLLWRSAPEAFRYAFSRPVSVVTAGMNTMEMLREDIAYADSFAPMTDDEYSTLIRDSAELGDYVCRQCNKCIPCPEGVPITDIFRFEGYFDRQMANGTIKNPEDFALKERLRFWFGNKELAQKCYADLTVKAGACTSCGSCMPKCPYRIDIIRKLGIADYKLAGKLIF